MLLKELMLMYEALDSSFTSGDKVKMVLESIGDVDCQVIKVEGERGSTDFIRIKIEGKNGKSKGGNSPTLAIVGRLGGVGARPVITGYVSDGDGALVVLTLAAKLVEMRKNGDFLNGDILISTHVTPSAPCLEHYPVAFMDSPVDMSIMNKYEVFGDFDALISVDTTKGNNIINVNGFAISPTVKDGYILKVSEDLLKVMERTSGKRPNVFAISMQDITPYGNGVYHINSIMQPSVVTDKPVVGLAITSESTIAGNSTEASQAYVLENCARYLLAVSKDFGQGKIEFYDEKEFDILNSKYGSMNILKNK